MAQRADGAEGHLVLHAVIHAHAAVDLSEAMLMDPRLVGPFSCTSRKRWGASTSSMRRAPPGGDAEQRAHGVVDGRAGLGRRVLGVDLEAHRARRDAAEVLLRGRRSPTRCRCLPRRCGCCSAVCFSSVSFLDLYNVCTMQILEASREDVKELYNVSPGTLYKVRAQEAPWLSMPRAELGSCRRVVPSRLARGRPSGAGRGRRPCTRLVLPLFVLDERLLAAAPPARTGT